MPLPSQGERLSFPNSRKLSDASNANPPVTKENSEHSAQRGNAIWLGKKLVISDTGYINYWYVPQAPSKVSYCVVPCYGRGDAYVISDQFGGCEWHVLQNDQFRLLAFLHVSRGHGETAKYQMAPGWRLIQERRSANVSSAGAYLGRVATGRSEVTEASGVNWAISCINRSGKEAAVSSAFVNVLPHQDFLVRIVGSGAGPYAPKRS